MEKVSVTLMGRASGLEATVQGKILSIFGSGIVCVEVEDHKWGHTVSATGLASRSPKILADNLVVKYIDSTPPKEGIEAVAILPRKKSGVTSSVVRVDVS